MKLFLNRGEKNAQEGRVEEGWKGEEKGWKRALFFLRLAFSLEIGREGTSKWTDDLKITCRSRVRQFRQRCCEAFTGPTKLRLPLIAELFSSVV